MRGIRTLPLILAVLTGGCGSVPRMAPPEEDGPAGMERATVLLLPIRKESGTRDLDADEFARLLVSEWVRRTGNRMVRMEPSEDRAIPLEEALRWARERKANTLIAVTATRYDPYDPPALGLAVQMFRARARPLPEEAVDRLVRSASWHCGPIPLGRPDAGHWMGAWEHDFDTRDARIRERLRAYLRERSRGDRPAVGEPEYLAIQPLYLRFVASELVGELLRVSNENGS